MKNRKKARLIPRILLFLAFLSIEFQILEYFTSIFFLPRILRYLSLGSLLAIAFFFTFILNINLKNNHFFASYLQSVLSPIYLLTAVLIAVLLFISNKLPDRFIPVEHNLRISASSGSGLIINSIKKNIEEPREETIIIDWDGIRQANPDLEFKNNDIYIYKNEELSYSSFFAGCIQIEVQPIRDDDVVVQTQFDNKSSSMELVKNGNLSVPIILCSESNFFNLSWKWKLIVIILQSLDIIFYTFLISNIFFLLSTVYKVQKGKAAGLDIPLARKMIIFFMAIFLVFHFQFFIEIITDKNPNIPKPIFYSSGYKTEDLFLDSRHPKSAIDYVSFLILEKNPEIIEIYIPESVRSLCIVSEEKLDQWIPGGVAVFNKKPETVQEIQNNGEYQRYTIESNHDKCTNLFIKEDYGGQSLYMQLINDDLYAIEINTIPEKND